MPQPTLRWMVVSMLLTAAPAFGQQRPSPQDAEALLRSSPDLAAQVRTRLRESGLTPDQVRARLRAEGYPESLLDGYLEPGGRSTDSIPSAATLSALRALSIDTQLDSLGRPGADPWSRLAAGPRLRPSVTCDTTIATPPAVQGADSVFLDARREPTNARQVTCRTLDGRIVPPPDSGRTIFGLDLFAQPTSQFDPNVAGAIDRTYRLGAGDQLVLLLTGDVELAHRLDVTREGFVFIPQVGQLHVANLSLEQVDELLYGVLGRVYPGVRRGAKATTRFSLSVTRLGARQVFVTGDVARPGSYRVSSAGTALTALYAAGGPTANGSLRRVEIRRGGEVVDLLDVYDYLLRGDASHDPRLESGDVVFVPIRGPTVRIVGEVHRPATYELRSGESLRALVRAAGGFRATAVLSRVQIERILPANQRREGEAPRVVLDVTLRPSHLLAGDGGTPADTVDATLEDGDVVRVFPISERVRNRITIAGDVWQPGSQGFTTGLTLSDAIARAGGIRPDAYLGQVLITRTLADSTRVQLRTALRSDGTTVDHVVLASDDEVRVFSVAEFRPNRTVTITGAVKHGGTLAYRDGLTLRDLLLLAGGLDESAYLGEAEIARLPENRADGETATTVRVRLDSSYFFRDRRATATSGEVGLRPDDHVSILRRPDWTPRRLVVVTGEVRLPGTYSLERRDERLRDLLRRAGGLTGNADSAGIVFDRARDSVGRVGIDLPAALRDARASDNLVLQDGDSIHIPAYSGVVAVAGAVNAPMAVAYVRGASLDYYVRAAGGPSRAADTRHAYVTHASGKVETVQRRRLWPDAVPAPGPGSRVTVPERAPNDGSTLSRNLPVIASIVGSLVTLAAVLVR